MDDNTGTSGKTKKFDEMHDSRIAEKSTPRNSEVRDTLLQAAGEYIIKKSWSDLTTNKLADYAGYSIGSLYRYFKNKDELMQAMVKRQLEIDYARFKKMIEESPKDESVEQRVSKIVHFIVLLYKNSPKYRSVIFAESKRFNAFDADAELEKRFCDLLIEAHDKRQTDNLEYKRPNELGVYVIVSSAFNTLRSISLNRPEYLAEQSEELERLFVCMSLACFQKK